MKKMVDDTRLIFKCCSLYYQDHKGQQEICDILGISRPTVSRMLKQGRERGVVKIEITNPENVAYGQLERKLEQLFGLQESSLYKAVPWRWEDSISAQRLAVLRWTFCPECCPMRIMLGFPWG